MPYADAFDATDAAWFSPRRRSFRPRGAGALPAATGPSILFAGQYLEAKRGAEAGYSGPRLVSPNRQFRLELQADGNLVMYRSDGHVLRAWGARGGRVTLNMQTDGNLVLYQNGRAVWASDTRGGGAKCAMQDDGNLVVYAGGRATWSSETNGGKDYSPSKGVFGAIGSAVGDVAHAVTHNPVASLVASPINAAAAIARGDNVLSTLGNHFKDQVKNLKDVAPIAQTVVSFVPGVGAGVNAAIAAGTALAQGHNITDALLSAAKNALPGGPLAARAFDAAYTIGKAAATGQNIGEAALTAARNQAVTQFGPVAGAAFDTGLAIAHGQNVQNAVTSGAVNLVKDQALSLAKGAVPKMPNLPPLFIPDPLANAATKVSSLANTLAPQVNQAARALLHDPSLRGLPVDQVAKKLGVPVGNVRSAVASIVGTAKRVGAPATHGMLPALSAHPNLEGLIGGGQTLDGALAELASRAAPVAFSPNPTPRPPSGGPALRVADGRLHAIRWRSLSPRLLARLQRRVPPNVAAMIGLQHVQGASEARGLTPDGTSYIVEKGDSPSKIAKKLTGNEKRWTELKTSNPTIATRIANGQLYFYDSKGYGETLKLPASWVATPAPQGGGVVTLPEVVIDLNKPAVPVPTAIAPTTVPAAPPTIATPAVAPPPGALEQAKAMLSDWAATEGKSSPADFGTTGNDFSSDANEPRFKSSLASFQRWINQTKGSAVLRTDGMLDDATYQALVTWTQAIAATDTVSIAQALPATPAAAPVASSPANPAPSPTPFPSAPSSVPVVAATPSSSTPSASSSSDSSWIIPAALVAAALMV